MPAESQPKTSATVIRIPRIHGFPPRLPGSMVIILRYSIIALSPVKPICLHNYCLTSVLHTSVSLGLGPAFLIGTSVNPSQHATLRRSSRGEVTGQTGL